jgi:hypothetical protein
MNLKNAADVQLHTFENLRFETTDNVVKLMLKNVNVKK